MKRNMNWYKGQNRERLKPRLNSAISWFMWQSRIPCTVQSLRPCCHKDINSLEKVQKELQEWLKSLTDLTHEERLNKLVDLTRPTLKTTRLRRDLIEAFKIVKDLRILTINFFTLPNSKKVRGHSLKLYEFRFSYRPILRKSSFSKRITNKWNTLDSNVFECSSVLRLILFLMLLFKTRGVSTV